MVFSSTVFLFLFLPVVLALYRILPRCLRNTLLLCVSLLFYAWGEPIYVLLMLFTTVFNYACGILIDRFRRHENQKTQHCAKAVLIISIIVNIGMLGFFKYTDFVVDNINNIFGASPGMLNIALPIGISFYTFQTLSYTIDVYRKQVKTQYNIIDFGMFVSMFPQLIAGPIVRYSDIEKQIKPAARADTAKKFALGIVRFSIGLGKKVLLANQIGMVWDEIAAMGGNIPTMTAWVGALAFAFQIYFDFSGYSDMAIGMGMMFGFDFPENFRYPYEAVSITDFWRRWHITLSSWFREYLYIPLGGNRRGPARQILNLFIVWFLTGLWHGAGWNFILWGVYFFFILAAEKLFLLKIMEKCPSFFKHLYSIILILFSWVIFSADNIATLPLYIKSMFGQSAVGFDGSLYYLMTNAVLLIILILGSTRLPKRAVEYVFEKAHMNEQTIFIIKAVFAITVFVISVAFMIGDSYNPFLYFRF